MIKCSNGERVLWYSMVLFFLFIFQPELECSEKDSLIQPCHKLFEALDLYNNPIDTNIFYADLAFSCYYDNKSWERAINCLSALSALHYYNEAFSNSYIYAKKALELAKEKLPEDLRTNARALNNIAVYHDTRGEYLKAIDLYKKAARLQLANNDSIYLAKTYHNIGMSFMELADVDEAISFLTRALDIRLEFPEKTGINIAGNYIELGHCHQKKERWTKSMDFYKKAIQLIIKLPEYHSEFSKQIEFYAYLNLGQIHFKLGEFQEAEKNLVTAMEIQSEYQVFDSYKSFMLLADIKNSIGDHYNALDLLDRAQEDVRTEYKDLQKSAGSAKVMGKMAEVHFDLGNYEQALQLMQKAMQEISVDQIDAHLNLNPAPSSFIDINIGLQLL